VAKLFNDAGMIVLAAFVAPDEDVRQKVAAAIGRERFLVVHLDCPLEVCKARDTDGHYPLAERGELANFPGISAPYDPPTTPDLVLKTDKIPVAQCVEQILGLLAARGIVD
jgi:bifunctional enzyme CysN/CysC